MPAIKELNDLIVANTELVLQKKESESLAKELVLARQRINQLEESSLNNFKEISDYKYALDESSIIAITDQKGIIKKVNGNFCSISKYSEEELIGQDHRIINSGYHPKEFMRDLWLTIANGKIWKGELKNKAKDGACYWVDTTIVPFLNERGKPYQYLSIRADISNRKETEGNLIQRTAQLEAANKNLLTFTFISSHDLQEPLRKIQTFAAILLETEKKNLSEEGICTFQRMKLAAERMQLLINDLLAFTKIPTTELKFEKTELISIINEVTTELKDSIEEKRASIEFGENGSANIIGYQFRQLLYNVINNSLKFSQAGKPPHIIIKSSIVNGSAFNIHKLCPGINYCHIAITDNGIGFEPHFSERIFVMFQKLHSKEKYGGTGIGLAIVKKVVENHNGIIIATSELNKGTTIDIYIPE